MNTLAHFAAFLLFAGVAGFFYAGDGWGIIPSAVRVLMGTVCTFIAAMWLVGTLAAVNEDLHILQGEPDDEDDPNS